MSEQKHLCGSTFVIVLLSQLVPNDQSIEQPIVTASAEEPAQEHINLVELSKRSVADLTDSAARPAPKLDGPSMPRSVQECNAWLKLLPTLTLAQCKPIEGLESTITLLQSCSSRQRRRQAHRKLKAAGGIFTK